MSDRDAFVQAIAANPADDLPRLVFADWLDEHGDPERAEFIRTQIRWHHALPDERKQLGARTADLFREHWQRWFGPFLLSLAPDADLDRDYKIGKDARYTSVNASDYDNPQAAVWEVDVSRGFVESVNLNLDSWGERACVADALRLEPVTSLNIMGGLHSPVWARFTDPVLRRVSVLHLHQHWSWNLSAPESTALLEDPHLAGVRTFSLFPEQLDYEGNVPLPVAWVERFTRSSLAYRLTDLNLWSLPAGGVVPLCRPGRLRLERLFLGGATLTPDDVHRLWASESGQTVVALGLHGELSDAVVAALARDEWPKLRELDLGHNKITAAVLPALAAASFTPRLEKLDLSVNPLFENAAEPTGLERLAEMLDPDRLRELKLRMTGLDRVPDFLAERFGDRVTV